eukprot:jgi/Mesvir1/8806/Mv02709-RA.1
MAVCPSTPLSAVAARLFAPQPVCAPDGLLRAKCRRPQSIRQWCRLRGVTPIYPRSLRFKDGRHEATRQRLLCRATAAGSHAPGASPGDPVQPATIPAGAPASPAQKTAASRLATLHAWIAVLPRITAWAVGLTTIVALLVPSMFAWVSPASYAPILGMLMFAMGLNMRTEDFKAVITKRPLWLATGFAAHWVIKPVLGVLLASLLIPALGLEAAVGTGLILTTCVSGAQLANYATFITHPEMAPFTISLTALTTISGVALTPLLSLALLGTRVSVDLGGMAASIAQIVLLPVASGVFINARLRPLADTLRPYMPLLAFVLTVSCIGSPVALSSDTILSPLGAKLVLPVVMLHAAAFAGGYALIARTRLREILLPEELEEAGDKGDTESRGSRASSPGVGQDSAARSSPGAGAGISSSENGAAAAAVPTHVKLSRALAYTTGMQSSLLATLLATKYFSSNPNVAVPCVISTVIMTMMGYFMSSVWQPKKEAWAPGAAGLSAASTPAVKPSPATPAVKPSPATPAVKPSPATPAVKPSPATPAVKPSPATPAVKPSPATPAVKPSPATPAVKPSPATPAVKPSPATPAVKPSPATTNVSSQRVWAGEMAAAAELPPRGPQARPPPAKAVPKPKPTPKSLAQELAEVVALLQRDLGAQGVREVSVGFLDRQVFGSFWNGRVIHNFWLFFPDSTLNGEPGNFAGASEPLPPCINPPNTTN